MRKFILLLFCTIFCSAFNAQAFEIDGIVYSSGPQGISVFSAKNAVGYVVIPEKVTNPHNGITSSVKVISESAFSGCDGLTGISIPGGVEYIEKLAFENCTNLKEVRFEDSNTHISFPAYTSDYSFKGCNIERLYVGRDISGTSTINLCLNESFKELEIGPGTTTVYKSQFDGCTGLKTLKIADSTNSLTIYSNKTDEYPFKDCVIENLYVGRNLSSWEPLSNPQTLKSVELGPNVTEIGQLAFYNCDLLTEFTIPSTIKSIGYAAFGGSAHVFIFENPEPIDTWENVYSLPGIGHLDDQIWVYVKSEKYQTDNKDIHVIYNSEFHPVYEDGVHYLSIADGEYTAYQADRELPATVRVKNGTQSMPEYIFKSHEELRSIIFPNSLTDIPQLPTSLRSLTIGQNVIWFPLPEMTHYCKLFMLPNVALDFVPFNSFSLIYAATDAYGSEATVLPQLSSMFEVDGIRYVPVSMSDRTCMAVDIIYEHGRKNYTIPENVNYKGVDFKVTSIGKGLFAGSELDEIDIRCNYTELPGAIFSDCVNIEECHVPADVATINSSAFWGCTGLKRLYLYEGEDNLWFLGQLERSQLEEVLVGRNILGSSPFRDIATLKTAWVSDGVKLFPEHMFYHCSGLENLYIGDGVSKLGDWSLSGCSALKIFNIGKNLASIGDNALSDCSGLTDIYAEPMVPPTVATQGLDDINKWECTLHYHEGAPYNTADQWKDFLFVNHDFAVTMPSETITAAPGSLITVTAKVADAIEADKVIWRSSNPAIAEIIEPVSAAADEIAVKVKIHAKKQVSIAAFLPSGQMANCVINKNGDQSSIENVAGPANSESAIYDLSGRRVFAPTTPGIYIINSQKHLIK